MLVAVRFVAGRAVQFPLPQRQRDLAGMGQVRRASPGSRAVGYADGVMIGQVVAKGAAASQEYIAHVRGGSPSRRIQHAAQGNGAVVAGHA